MSDPGDEQTQHESTVASGPPVASPPSSGESDPGPPGSVRRSARLPWIAAALFGLLAVVFFGLWLGARQDLDGVRQDLDDIQAVEEAEQAELDALPDLRAVASEHRIPPGVIEDISEDTLSMNFYLQGTSVLGDVLEDLGFSSAIMARIGNTRALDGTLTAEAPDVLATWTYHPDNGLSIVLEVTG